MIGFSIEQIARVTDGVLDQVVDPARIVTGPVVLPGEHANGHDFAGQAVAAGAELVIGARPTDVALPLSGAHNVTNALAAAALAGELGMTVDAIAAGLSAAVARSHWRMEVTERADGVIVVNDAYNSSPEAPGEVVLVKASRATGLQTVALALTSVPEPPAQEATP